MGLSIVVSHAIFRKKGSHANFADKRFCVVFTNCGFMGLPLLDALYGSEGLFLGLGVHHGETICCSGPTA